MRIFKNPNRQDTLFGGLILGGFVVVAIIAALFMLFSWRGEQTADVPKTTVGRPLMRRPRWRLPHLLRTDNYPTPAFSRISSMSFEASAFVSLSSNASGVPA